MAEREIEKWVTVNGHHVPIYKDAIDTQKSQIEKATKDRESFNKQKRIENYVKVALDEKNISPEELDRVAKDLGYSDVEIERLHEFHDVMLDTHHRTILTMSDGDYEPEEYKLWAIKLSDKPDKYKLLVGSTYSKDSSNARWEDADSYDASDYAWGVKSSFEAKRDSYEAAWDDGWRPTKYGVITPHGRIR